LAKPLKASEKRALKTAEKALERCGRSVGSALAATERENLAGAAHILRTTLRSVENKKALVKSWQD